MIDNPSISIVSPVYNAESILDELVKRILPQVKLITNQYELILVNDGSKDNSWEKLLEIAAKNENIKAINLSRNFGQHQALTCALASANGDFVIAMDCDLQDNPKYIPQLYQEIQKGYDVVYTSKKRWGHSRRKNFLAYLFNKVFNYLIDNPEETTSDGVGTLSIISRKVVDAFCAVDDYERLYLMTLRWLGFRSTTIVIEHDKRFAGKSSYTFKRLVNHALNGITYQSDKLLRLNISVGFFIAFVAMLGAGAVIVLYFVYDFMSGWASLIVTMFFMLGTILMSIGILGLYIAKIFDQVKGRPKYIIMESVNI